MKLICISSENLHWRTRLKSSYYLFIQLRIFFHSRFGLPLCKESQYTFIYIRIFSRPRISNLSLCVYRFSSFSIYIILSRKLITHIFLAALKFCGHKWNLTPKVLFPLIHWTSKIDNNACQSRKSLCIFFIKTQNTIDIYITSLTFDTFQNNQWKHSFLLTQIQTSNRV